MCLWLTKKRPKRRQNCQTYVTNLAVFNPGLFKMSFTILILNVPVPGKKNKLT